MWISLSSITIFVPTKTQHSKNKKMSILQDSIPKYAAKSPHWTSKDVVLADCMPTAIIHKFHSPPDRRRMRIIEIFDYKRFNLVAQIMRFAGGPKSLQKLSSSLCATPIRHTPAMKDFSSSEVTRVAGGYKQNYADNNANLALFCEE